MAMAMAMDMAMQIGVCSALYKVPLTHFGEVFKMFRSAYTLCISLFNMAI